MKRKLTTGRALTLLVIVVGALLWFVGMFGALLTEPSSTPEPTVTPTIQVRVLPESPVPATATLLPDIFTVSSPSPELVWSTPMATATATSEPTGTSTPESTRVPASPVQKG